MHPGGVGRVNGSQSLIQRTLETVEKEYGVRAFLVLFEQDGRYSIVCCGAPEDPIPDTGRLDAALRAHGVTNPRDLEGRSSVALPDIDGHLGSVIPLPGTSRRVMGALVLVGDTAPVSTSTEAAMLSLVADNLGAYLELASVAQERTGEQESLRAAAQQYESLFSLSPDAIFIFERDLQLIDMNAAATQLTGYSLAEVAGNRYLKTLAAGSADYLTYLLLGGLMGNAQDGELTLCHKRGDEVPFAVKVTPIRVGDQITGVFCNAVDISEQRLIAEQLTESEQRYRTLFENSTDAIMVFDHDGNLVRHNAALERMTGYTSADLLDKGYARLFGKETLEHVQEVIGRTLQGEKVTTEVSVERAAGGTAYWLVNTIPMNLDRGETGAYMLAKDVTAQKHAERQMARMAYRDSLTGLANRALFHERLRQAIERKTYAGQQFALLFLDLDGFKLVNDSLGHESGDLLLTQAGKRLVACVRPTDTVARLGGDEFTVLLEVIPSREHAEAVADRLVAELKKPFWINGKPVVISASVGVVFSDDATTPSDLLRYADMAMYHAKNTGKGRWAAFEPAMDAQTTSRLDLDIALRRALSEGEFRLYYQPIVDLRSGQTCAVEALLRWAHPRKGLVQPAEFVPHAEETGEIITIGLWVLDHACAQFRTWRQKYQMARSLALTVNLSARQLLDPELPTRVKEIVEKHRLPHEALHLEITETAVVADMERARASLAALREMGVKIAVDDFGTGYAWFDYLNRFGVDIIKIDRSFTREITKSRYSRGLVSAIVSFAKEIGLTVCAEGIETAAQCEQMRSLGCDHGQGYYFGKPESPERIAAMLHELELHRTTKRQSAGA